MDWKKVLALLTVNRLSQLAANAGLAGVSRMRKAKLVDVLHLHLDDALKHEALLLLRGDELRALARVEGVGDAVTRKQELIGTLLSVDDEEQEQELSEGDFLLPDRERHDVPEGGYREINVEVLPSRPGGAELATLFELQELLRRPSLSRAVIVTPNCYAHVLQRLVGEGLDDLIESAARWRPHARDDRAMISIIVDGEEHGLDSEVGSALVSLARKLGGRFEIRLAPPGRRLHAKVFTFEEVRPEGPWLTGLVGSTHEVEPGEESPPKPDLGANVRVSGALDASDTPASLLKEWVTHLVRDSRSLSGAKLEAMATHAKVSRKVDYKLEFDTAHELRLKHLAEQLCRRGRYAAPMFDPTALLPPPEHQRAAVVRAAEPWRRGFLLCDEAGLGKTVEAGLILSRELRRRRIYASSDTSERRRALIVAPTSLHGHWQEELRGKLGFEAEIVISTEQDELSYWRVGSQIAICSPEMAAEHWEDIQGVEILVVDDAHLYDEDIIAALAGIRSAAELCIVTSGAPAQQDLLDVLPLASLVEPGEAWDSYTLFDNDGLDAGSMLGRELGDIASRARRSELIEQGRLPKRAVTDTVYELDELEAGAYAELRRMRFDYLERSGRETAWAFIVLEQTFLSSSHAFAAAARRLLGEAQTHSDLFDARSRADGSLAFLRSSGYFRRRLRGVCDELSSRTRPAAPVSGKEAALLEVLSTHGSEPVVIFTGYRATQQRLASVLARSHVAARIEQLDQSSSLRERRSMVARFARSRHDAAAEGPGGVLITTDKAAETLTLQETSSVLINYDLPWNPQVIERRIGRLQAWGQLSDVKVDNLAARSPVADGESGDGWTMDARILQVCRQLFEMAEPEACASDALFEIDPDDLEANLAGGSEAALSLIEEPDEEVLQELDRLLEGDRTGSLKDRIEDAQVLDGEYRTQLAEFWSRVSYRASTLQEARGYLFGRLQLALCQGQVGVLCAPGRNVDECDTFHLAVGLRLLFEAAVYEDGSEPLDDQWLVDDEVVYLWAVSPEGKLVDWAEFLMGDGLVEVPQDKAAKIVGQDVLDYLVREKRALESRDLDAVPFAAWSRKAPASVMPKLQATEKHAGKLARARLKVLTADWEAAKARRLERLRERLLAAGDAGAPEAALASIDACIANVERERVEIRLEVLGTQLFAITH